MGIKIKSMKYEDFKDNETLELLNKSGSNVLLSTIDQIINWGRSNSIWPLTFATSCCGIEMMAAGAPDTTLHGLGWKSTVPHPDRQM